MDEHDAGALGERVGRLESEVGELRTELRCALRRVKRLLVIGFFLTYASLSAMGPESRTRVRSGLPLVAAVTGERLPSAPPRGPIAAASRYSNAAIGFGLVFGGRPRIARPEASNVPAPRSGTSGKPALCGEGLYVEARLSGGGGSGVTSHAPSGVRAILDERRRVGGEHSSLCFWAPGVIWVRELAPFERIAALGEDLIAADEVELAFVSLEHDRYAP